MTDQTSRAGERKLSAKNGGAPAPTPQLATSAPAVVASPTPAPTAPPSPLPSAQAVAEPAVDERPTAASPAPQPSAAPAAPSAGKRQVARIGRYVGMPGQRGVWIDELVREDMRVSLRVRVEGGAGTVEVRALEIEGTPAAVRTEVAGKDLVVIGEVPLPAQKPRQATLAMAERGRFRKEKLKLVGPGLADLVFDGGRTW